MPYINIAQGTTANVPITGTYNQGNAGWDGNSGPRYAEQLVGLTWCVDGPYAAYYTLDGALQAGSSYNYALFNVIALVTASPTGPGPSGC